MLLIGARASNGKSTFAINIAVDLASQGKRVMFLSLEMPKEKIIERIFCLCSRVDNIELLTGGYVKNNEIKKKYQKFKDSMSKWEILIGDCIGRDWAWLEQYVFKNLKDSPDCVIIDHVQEIRGGQSKKESIDEYISKMREMAVRYNFALILCSQVNRTAADEKGKEPQLHQLKGTGYLEEAADQVILLHWPFHYATDGKKVNKEEYTLNVAKNRDGMTGFIKMKYFPEYYHIADW